VPGIRLLKAKAEVETSHRLSFALPRTSRLIPSRRLVHYGVMSGHWGQDFGGLVVKVLGTSKRLLRYLFDVFEV
jgi:hypothetical protein